MLTDTERLDCVAKLREFPAHLRQAVAGLSEAQLLARPLPGEWSVAQNVHHLADSHMNSFIRLKLVLTETNPTVRPYDQDLWAELPEANNADIETSLQLLDALHARWSRLFASLTPEQRQRTGLHPANGTITPDTLLQDYVAHGEGHLDQIARTLAAAGNGNR